MRRGELIRGEPDHVMIHQPSTIELNVGLHLVGGRPERIEACRAFLEELITGPIEAIVRAEDNGADYRARYAFTRSLKQLWRYAPSRGVFSIAEVHAGWDFTANSPKLAFLTPAVSYLIGSDPVGTRGLSYTIRRCSS